MRLVVRKSQRFLDLRYTFTHMVELLIQKVQKFNDGVEIKKNNNYKKSKSRKVARFFVLL